MAEKPEDLNLPNAVITRIIKESLPEGVNISKEARAAISKAASVFVLYATSSANNFAIKAKRKTLTGQDVLSAMEDMEFEKFIDPLTECLEVFRKEQKGKREASEKKRKVKENLAKKSEEKITESENGTEHETNEENELSSNTAPTSEDN